MIFVVEFRIVALERITGLRSGCVDVYIRGPYGAIVGRVLEYTHARAPQKMIH